MTKQGNYVKLNMVWTLLQTQWACFDLSMLSNATYHEINWKAMYELYMCFIHMLIIRCTIHVYEVQPIESYLTLIWPLHVIQFWRSWDKLRGHTWLYICVYNKHIVITSLVYKIQPAENSMTLISPFNVILCQMIQGKLNDHIWRTVCVSYKLCSYDVPFMRYTLLNVLWHIFDLYRYSKVKGQDGKPKDDVWLHTCFRPSLHNSLLLSSEGSLNRYWINWQHHGKMRERRNIRHFRLRKTTFRTIQSNHWAVDYLYL